MHGAVPLLPLIVLAGCAAQLVAPYDARTDALLTDVQRKVVMHFEELAATYGTPACRYENQQQFYRDVRVDVRVVGLRARVLPMNEATVEGMEALSDALAALERLHRASAEREDYPCIPPAGLIPAQRAIESAIGALLKLELAKQRGA